jgi:apolipoprotein D and lipocalin family protein
MPRMTQAVVLGLALVLAGCAAPPEAAFRRAETPIYSNALLDTARLAGTWTQVGDFAQPGVARCAPGVVAIRPVEPATLQVDARLCLNGTVERFAGAARVTGPGRVTLQGAAPEGLGAEWWVLWVDDGYRTLVIGTPSGRFGFILDRSGDLPPDRLAAAREVLDWNGYALAALRATP